MLLRYMKQSLLILSFLVRLLSIKKPRAEIHAVFWEMDYEVLYTCSTSPCQQGDERCFLNLFFARYLVVVFDIWASIHPKFSSKKNTLC